MHRIAVLALPDVVAMQVAVPSQVFGHREQEPLYSVILCAQQPGAVTTTAGFTIEAAGSIDDIGSADTVMVAGFWPPTRPSDDVLTALREAAARGARMVSFCTGSFALAEAGVLDGRQATTHWQEIEEFVGRFPTVRLRRDVLYVDDGQFLTAAGDSAAIDLCLHLLENDHGVAAANAARRRMLAAELRGADDPKMTEDAHPDLVWSLAGTREWALAHLAEHVSIELLARHASIAVRTFTRRFRVETGTTPLRWLTAQRLIEARRLLETTDLNVDMVAQRSGLGTAANLRQLMVRDAGVGPSAYRSAFRGSASG